MLQSASLVVPPFVTNAVGQVLTKWPVHERPEVKYGSAMIAGLGLAAFGGSKLWHRYILWGKRIKKRYDRESELSQVREKIDLAIKNGEITESEIKYITGLSTSDLVEHLKEGKLKCIKVLWAYQKQALEIHEETNCLVAPILEAEEWALAADKNPNRQGMLYGVPVSIKDNILIEGHDATVGCSNYLYMPADEDGAIVKTLKLHGAIPFMRTNMPQTGLSVDSCNPIYGQTVNPFDKTRTSGGSSSGEGALLGGGGSVLGIGNDIGGSLRVPAHCCGICTIKPGKHRISYEGIRSASLAYSPVNPVNGPMARDVDGVVLGFRGLVNQGNKVFDPFCPVLPFQEELFTNTAKLKVGYYVFDGFFECHPACKRAVDIAKKALEKRGYELVEIDVTDITQKAFEYYTYSVAATDGEQIFEALNGDWISHTSMFVYALYSIPRRIKMLLSYLVLPFSKRVSQVLHYSGRQMTVDSWFRISNQIMRLRQEVALQWSQEGFDAVLSPVIASPAMKVGHPGLCMGHLSYSIMYNLLDFPAGTVPVTKVSPEDEEQMKSYQITDVWDKVMRKSAVGSTGLPVGVQIAGIPWTEERILRVMKELESDLKQE